MTRKDYVDRHNTNPNYLKTDGTNMMTGDLNMNEQKVKNMLDPVDEQDSVNKRFLEAQLQDYLKTNGQTPMSFNLNMNNDKIVNLKNFDSGNTSNSDAPDIKYIKDNYVHRSLGILQGNLNANNNKIIYLTLPTNIEDATNKEYVDDNFFKLDGTNSTSASLNLNNNLLINLADPISETNATNKKYVDDKIKASQSHRLSNVFKYIMQDLDEISSENRVIVDKIDDLSWSFHTNKKVVFFKAIKSGLNYNYKIGIQVTPVSDGNKTICIEQLFQSQTLWNKAQIAISGLNVTIKTNHTTKFSYNIDNTEFYYLKTVIQLKKKRWSKPLYLLFNLSRKYTFFTKSTTTISNRLWC